MYTCNTCSLQFPTAEDQRVHMKSDWHRYNLKRRVANLPAINEALFLEKVSKLTINEEEETPRKEVKNNKQITKKEQRRIEKEALLEKKKQLLEIAKQNMLKSYHEGTLNETNKVITSEKKETIVKEEEEVAKLSISEESKEEKKDEVENLTDDQLAERIMEEKLKNKVEIPLEVCLFCNKKFPYFDACITHMHKNHGFYIPEQKYLVDKEGLVRYMGEKIGLGNVCVVCDFQGRSIEAVRAHMLSKNHCRIPYEEEDEKLEISQFYDFSSTYDDISFGDDDGDWEDVEGEDVGDDDVEEEEEEDLPQQVSYNDGVELHLPNGTRVGHRSLARYYRQNLRPDQVLTEGQGTVIAAESRHLMTIADRGALLEKKRIWKNEKHHQDRDDRRAAKFINNQPHYRDQLLQ
ncbi:hypothetical protein WICMUC_002604 [Wickerhamomyces mucosus]|uniref:C2H2-type domain-containing protein n=1 Tax=Wickerhamomyces mucosus TaxID=1378264 RepID=A0A9P8TED3_9ASCO|nr:hypothetical protein WICMUC_002604 [Wickerhamomyces mucosus]